MDFFVSKKLSKAEKILTPTDMDIIPIRTQEDYEMACGRIQEIINAEPGSEEDDELDVFITLVDAYEERHFPFGVSPF